MEYKIVAINNDGEVVGVERYDHTNNNGRSDRRQEAANIIADRIGVPRPILSPRGTGVSNGIEFGPMSGDIEAGMVEIGIGKWGFNK